MLAHLCNGLKFFSTAAVVLLLVPLHRFPLAMSTQQDSTHNKLVQDVLAPKHAQLLARVAHLYFEKGDDQSAIARQLRVSRSSVSRLLTQARRQGIVEIRIHYPLSLAHERGQELCQRFGLKEARVLVAGRADAEDLKQQVAQLAAQYLEEHLADGDTIAISRGSTLAATVELVSPQPRRNIRVVQLVGALRADSVPQDHINLARALAQKIGGEYYNLTAPLFVENVMTRRALLDEPTIREVLDLARNANLALVGIGSLNQRSSAILRQKLLGAAQVKQLRVGRAVGEICSQYFDACGKIVSTELSERTIALELAALQMIPRVIGVATGPHKARAILGALRGGYVNVLITDDETAERVLKHDRTRSRTGKANS